jgi:hypothetical protein
MLLPGWRSKPYHLDAHDACMDCAISIVRRRTLASGSAHAYQRRVYGHNRAYMNHVEESRRVLIVRWRHNSMGVRLPVKYGWVHPVASGSYRAIIQDWGHY